MVMMETNKYTWWPQATVNIKQKQVILQLVEIHTLNNPKQ
jgi:hypothetical protein